MVTKVVNISRGHRFDVYIGRPSVYGNPFSHKPNTRASWLVPDRAAAVAAYEAWVVMQPEIMQLVPKLRGLVLGCWCYPLPCHGHVLARLAEFCAP